MVVLQGCSPETNDAFFFVYGVVNPWDSQRTLGGTRASVIMGDFTAMVQAEDNLPLDTFNASYDETLVTIKDNVAEINLSKGRSLMNKASSSLGIWW